MNYFHSLFLLFQNEIVKLQYSQGQVLVMEGIGKSRNALFERHLLIFV